MPPGLRCVYQRIDVDVETGELVEKGCRIRNGDQYNIYPEFDKSTGDVIYQTPTVKARNGHILPSIDVDPLYQVMIWENITGQHQNGLSFDYRNFNAYEHPGYYMTEYPVPHKHGMLDSDSVADVFGDDNLTLVTPGWNEDKSYGRPNIERCNIGLYGRFDRIANLVIHRSMKNYTADLMNWENFTTFQDRSKQKLLFLMDASNEVIELYCDGKFEDGAKNMSKIMKAVRNGEYINLKEAAMNNSMSREDATSMMQDISLKSRKTIYQGNVNIQRICELYEYVARIGLDVEYVRMYRVNILNYILNYKPLQKLILAFPEFKTNQRYWFIYIMLKKAYHRDKIVNPESLPQWVLSLLKETKQRTPLVKVFDKIYDLRNAPPEVLDIVAESYAYRVKEPNRLFPAMARIKDVLGTSFEQATATKQQIFKTILRAGVLWNKTEVQTIWAKFTRYYSKKQARHFWNFIDEMDGLDYDVLASRAKGEGNLGLKKICFANLIQARTNFRGEDNWEVEIPKLVSSVTAGARHKAKFRQKKKYFWAALSRIGGLHGDKKLSQSMISDDRIQNLIEKEQLKDELKESYSAPSSEALLDSDEYNSYNEIDLVTGASNPMVSRGTNEENWIEGTLNG